MAIDPTVSDDELPDVDDRLVVPGTRYEMWDGELVYVSPAGLAHGTRHIQLAAIVEAHAGPDFEVAADMLTRTSRVDDIAPDVSVFPAALDPRTRGRQLEHVAFEIVQTRGLSRAGRKAHKLTFRGVRRVFAIDVQQSRVYEWLPPLSPVQTRGASRRGWKELDAASRIEDPVFEVPLPVAAMVHAARSDDAVARALVARRNPVIEAAMAEQRSVAIAEGKREGNAEGDLAGRAASLFAVLAARGLAVDAAWRDRIAAERDPRRLDRWIARAAVASSLVEALDGD